RNQSDRSHQSRRRLPAHSPAPCSLESAPPPDRGRSRDRVVLGLLPRQAGPARSPTGQVRDFPSPGGDGSEPYGIAVGTDGRIWYDESGTDQIVAFDPGTERAETVKIPTPGSVVRN